MSKHPKPRYRVLHTFAHERVLYGPWNAESVAKLPASFRESLVKRGRIEEIPEPVPSEPAVEPTHEA